MQQLHEMLRYLTEALTLEATYPIQKELSLILEETEQLTLLDSDSLIGLDVSSHRARVNVLLLKTNEIMRNKSLQQYKRSKK